MNGKVLNGRTLAASITTDNSHVPEFIRKCVYHDTNKVIARGVKLGLAWRAGPASSPKKLGWAGIWTHKSFRPAPFSLQAQQTLTLDLEASPFSFNFEPHQPHIFDWTSRASPLVPHSLPPRRRLHVSLTLMTSLSLKTLTLDLEPSPVSFDFKPQHQPHVFDWAKDMMLKFDKYWDECSIVLAFGVVFYPRIKFESLGFCYKKIDPLTWEMKVEKIKRKLYELWNFYAPKPKSSSSSDLIEYKEQVASDSGKSQLDTNLEEATLNLHFTAHMDVLDWWKTNSPRFPHLSIMACDLLSIPVTTVASESVFNIGSRILKKYRNRLSSDCVEAIICTRNWKHGFNEDDDDLFDEDSIVKTTSSKGASNVVDVD
ncbi:Zinc finger BED domain-containing protein DAYSLEEPER [Glycine max]|nr:Zinc finger BED domain-containing protein DAYSLEEPER [Glycine max]